MKKGYFEGEHYKDDIFKALIPKYYSLKYKKYIEEELELLKKKISGANRVLEAGVGIGRLIPDLAPLVKEFIGVDNAQLMLKKSREISKNFPNVKIVEMNLEELSKIYPKDHFDFSLCVWATLGNQKDESIILKELKKVTFKSIFITVYNKGTVEDRKNWYKTVGIKIDRVDEKNEVFYAKSGFISRSYNIKDIERLANKADLKIKEYKILSGVVLWAELEKV